MVIHNHRPTFAAYRAFCMCALYKFENNYLICKKCKKPLKTTSSNDRKKHFFEAVMEPVVILLYVLFCVAFNASHTGFVQNLKWLILCLVLVNVVDYLYLLLLCKKGYFQEAKQEK